MIRYIINKPIAVTMIAIAIIIMGLVSINLLGVSLMPDVDIPQITVQVNASNHSAREVDDVIIKGLRYELMQVNGLTDMRTQSQNGSGTIFMQFDYDTNIDYAFIEVNEKIDRSMQNIPEDVDRPKVIKASATDIPAFYVNISAKNNGEVLDSIKSIQEFISLSRLANNVIAKRFEQIPQVAMVDISGLVYPQLSITFDNDKLSAMGVRPESLESAISAANVRVGNLTIRDGEYQYSMRIESSLVSKEDLEQVYIRINDRLYQIRDLATVSEVPRKRSGLITASGDDVVTMAVIKQSDAKMSHLKENVKSLAGYLEKQYPTLDIKITRDQTQLLDYSISNLQSNLLVGAILACLIILFFMKDLRSPMLIFITIPLSLIVALLFFFIIGISINIISLSGLILGVGMMVDNSIIVIDNISQRWEKGDSLQEAIVRGTGEVFVPMLSSVLTTCSVFIPLIFLSGISGALFFDQAMAVTIGLFASLFVAILVIPVYYNLLYKRSSSRTENRFLAKLSFINYGSIYEKGVKWTFRHAKLVWFLLAALLLSSVFIYRHIPKEKLPSMTHNETMVKIDWNSNLTVEEGRKRAESLLSDDRIVEYTAMVGSHQFVMSYTPELSQSQTLIYVKTANQTALKDVEASIKERIRKQYPDASIEFEMAGNIFTMIFAENQAKIIAQIKSTDGSSPRPDKLNKLLSDIGGKMDVGLEPVLWQEYIELISNPAMMSLYGVGYSDILYSLRTLSDQNRLFTINEGNYSIPVVSGDKVIDDNTIINSKIKNKEGVEVPLSLIVFESRNRDLKNITGGRNGNYYPLNINVEDSRVPELVKGIREVVNENDDFDVDFTGSYFSNREMISELIIVLMVSLLLLYFILAAQFESVVQPFIILFEIIFDIVGALIVMIICGVSINLMSLIGLVVMCGIVINDSILKVDTINRLRKQGYSLLRAILTGGASRVKPILMTSLTTILALVPFLYRGDIGSDLQYPLSVALIGGMIVGTIVSLFVIPLLYYQIYRKDEASRQR